MAVCSEIHTKHINTLCGQNGELPIVKHGGTFSDHWALKGWIKSNIRDQSQYSYTYEHQRLAEFISAAVFVLTSVVVTTRSRTTCTRVSHIVKLFGQAAEGSDRGLILGRVSGLRGRSEGVQGRRASAGRFGVSPFVNIGAATVACRVCRRLIWVQVNIRVSRAGSRTHCGSEL